MPIADRAKGAVPVRVKLTVPADEEGVYLKPEMGAVVTFLNGPARIGPSGVPPAIQAVAEFARIRHVGRFPELWRVQLRADANRVRYIRGPPGPWRHARCALECRGQG